MATLDVCHERSDAPSTRPDGEDPVLAARLLRSTRMFVLFAAALLFLVVDHRNVRAVWTGDRFAIITRCPAADVGTTVHVPMADDPLQLALLALPVAYGLAARHKDVMAVRFAGATVALALVSSAVVSSSYLRNLLSREELGDECTARGLPAVETQLREVTIAYLNMSVRLVGLATLVTLIIALTPNRPAPATPWLPGRARRTIACLLIFVGVLTWLFWTVHVLTREEDPHLLPHAEAFTLLAALTAVGLAGFTSSARWRAVGRVALATAVSTAFTQWAFLYEVALDQYEPRVRSGDERGAEIFYDLVASQNQWQAMNEVRDVYYGNYIIVILFVWALVWSVDRLVHRPGPVLEPDA